MAKTKQIDSNIKGYKGSKHVFFSFTTKRNIRQFIIVGALGALIIVSSIIGYINLYPTQVARNQTAASLSSNAGLNALLGRPEALNTIEGFTAWRSLGVMVLILAIWALFISTRLLRGDEEQDRWELLLAGLTTLRKATTQVIASMGFMSVFIIILVTVATLLVSNVKSLSWSFSKVSFLAFSMALVLIMFLSIGALVSQLSATRAVALKIGGLIFGISFMLRALGDISDKATWLTNISPLGWIENLRPLTSSNVVWIIPIVGTSLVCLLVTLLIASQRDYKGSLLKDKDSKKPNYMLLSSARSLLARLQLASIWAWILGIFFANMAFGSFLGASSSAISSSQSAQDAINIITNSSAPGPTELMLGIIFLQMVLLMLLMVAGQVVKFREDEARGYIDNLLVRPVSRLGLISTKIILVFAGILLTTLAIYLGSLIGTTSQHIVINQWLYISSAINLIAVPVLVAGLGFALLGILPRYASLVLYLVISWSFVIEMIGGVLDLNHWLLDTSVLHHIAIAPATAVKWPVFFAYILIGSALSALGAWRYCKRDIELS